MQWPATGNKSVAFASSARMRPVLHINDYSTSEREEAFYSHDDFRAFKCDIRTTLKMMAGHYHIDDTEFCERGVKHRTSQASKVKKD
jgi:hypothetical protein